MGAAVAYPTEAAVAVPAKVTFDPSTDAEWRRLAKKAYAAAEARSRLPAGASRARVTTANARWATAAEARDRRENELRKDLK
jgi:hypothetical protein